MRKIVIPFLTLLFISCEFLQLKPSKENKIVIASVGEVELYESDIEGVVPYGVSTKDSIVLAKSYINSWAKQQLLLQKSLENVSKVNSNEIDELIDKYRESLYVNSYKESLIKQQLDTIVKPIEIVRYYKNNKENFKLNEELFKINFIYFGQDFLDKEQVIERFKSNNNEDLELLENQTINFKDYDLRDTSWITYDEFLEKIPPFSGIPKEKLLKVSKFIQTEDSLGVYLVAVKDILKRNKIAPLSYIKENIKQLVLHKRKLQLIRDIEKTLINDAIKNNNFKEY